MPRFGESLAERSRSALLVRSSLIFVLASLLFAQTSLASTLSGHVTSDGQPVAGAFVAATGPNGDAGAVSDSGGAFSLTLSDGTYRLAANAPGFKASVVDGVTVSGATVHDLSLTASGAKLTKLPIFGGGQNVAADGTPGVFYAAGGNVGNLYRSVDWGGTWTQVNLARDDATNGLSGAASPDFLTTSGVPGEVAVAVGAVPGLALPSGVFYSTDYGVTWRPVANSGSVPHGAAKAYWGHAGSRSVLVARTAFGTGVADMTAPNPSWVQMTTPYAPIGQPIAVGDGGDQPWLATVDASGQLSVYPLLAQASAPAPALTQAGFPANTTGVGIGGKTANGVPPAGIVVASNAGVTMTVKSPADTTYPAPAVPSPQMCAPGPGAGSYPQVTPNTAGSYGAAWIGGCWVQDSGGTITAQGVPVGPGGTGAAIDAGYDATDSSAGTDAVVMLAGAVSGSLTGISKAAATQNGFPVPATDPKVDAKPGTDPSSAGIARNGITAAIVFKTTLGPAGTGQVASAMDVGGVASDDGGASFHIATYDASASVAWWQGASGSWLLYGLTDGFGIPLVTGYLDWTSSTPPAGGVAGSSAAALGGGPYVQSIAGVPGQDAAFLDLASANPFGGNRTGVLRRVSIGAGPSFSNVTPIGDGVITKPGPLSYCPSAGSASTLQDVLVVIGQNQSGGALYRVTDATGASPTVTKVVDQPPTTMGIGSPALSADCASGTVLASAGGPGLLKSTDGGQSFSALDIGIMNIGLAFVKAVALTPGNPASIQVGSAQGFIYASADGGQSWAAVNDPATGENLNSGANFSGGIWDLAAPPATGPSLLSTSDAGLGALAPDAGLVAGPGEFQGKLSVGLRTLTVAKAGAGLGSVTSSPVGIDCGATCSHAYTAGARITLNATAASGSTFAGWSGGGCSGTGSCAVTMSADQSVTATFTATFTPSNRFSFGKVKLNKKKGTAKLSVKVPGPGKLTLKGKGVKVLSKTVPRAGTAKLAIKPTGKTKKALAKKGKAKVKVKVTFRPTGGSAASKAKKIKLVEKRR